MFRRLHILDCVFLVDKDLDGPYFITEQKAKELTEWCKRHCSFLPNPKDDEAGFLLYLDSDPVFLKQYYEGTGGIPEPIKTKMLEAIDEIDEGITTYLLVVFE